MKSPVQHQRRRPPYSQRRRFLRVLLHCLMRLRRRQAIVQLRFVQSCLPGDFPEPWPGFLRDGREYCVVVLPELALLPGALGAGGRGPGPFA